VTHLQSGDRKWPFPTRAPPKSSDELSSGSFCSFALFFFLRAAETSFEILRTPRPALPRPAQILFFPKPERRRPGPPSLATCPLLVLSLPVPTPSPLHPGQGTSDVDIEGWRGWGWPDRFRSSFPGFAGFQTRVFSRVHEPPLGKLVRAWVRGGR
jgi:hypothetical protein